MRRRNRIDGCKCLGCSVCGECAACAPLTGCPDCNLSAADLTGKAGKATIKIRLQPGWTGTEGDREVNVEVLHRCETFGVHNIVYSLSGYNRWAKLPFFAVSHLETGLALISPIGSLGRAKSICAAAERLLGGLDLAPIARRPPWDPTDAQRLGMAFVEWTRESKHLSKRALDKARHYYKHGGIDSALATLGYPAGPMQGCAQ